MEGERLGLEAQVELTREYRDFRYEQSLFEHSLNTLDVVLSYLPIFRHSWHPPLSAEEEVALIIAAVAHDAGKATEEFQRYIRGESNWVGHWVPELTQDLVSELYDLWSHVSHQNISSLEPQVREAIAAVQYTVRQERTQTLEAQQILRSDHLSQRWRLFMDVVDKVDNLVSCSTVMDAARFLEGQSTPLSRSVAVAYHQMRVRGVSTILLHQATQEVFVRQRWQPLLFYPEGTLYVSTKDGIHLPPTEEIRAELQAICRRELEKRSNATSELVVGNILQNFLPKPELFDAERLRDYLHIATTRARAKPAEKVKPWNVIKVADELYPELTQDIRRNGKLPSSPTSNEAARLENKLPQSIRETIREALGPSQPEMAIFKFFKNVVDNFFSESGSPEQATAYRAVKEQYELIFGPQTFAKLMGMSTLMPDRDYLLTVRFFQELPGSALGHPEVERVAFLRPEERQRLLADRLVIVAAAGFAQLTEKPSLLQLSQRAANIIISDLVIPADFEVKPLAERQIEAYTVSKARRTREALCPTCNIPLAIGTNESVEALKDFYGGNPEAFSNRRVAHGRKMADAICLNCYHERMLQQILLASRPEEVVVIFPRMNLAPYGARVLVDRVRGLEEEARRLTSPDTSDPIQRFDLTATWNLASTIASIPSSDLQRFGSDPRGIASAFNYRTAEQTRREYRGKLIKGLEEEFEKDLRDLNNFYDGSFSSFGEAAEAIVGREPKMWAAGEAASLTRRLYRDAQRLSEDFSFVLQTANLILIPIGHGFGGRNSSKAKADLSRLLTALFFALTLDVSAGIVPFVDLTDMIAERGLGIAYVPPSPELRDLIGTSWVSLAEGERWLRAIAAAFRLARLAEYPERSDVFQVLTEPSVGRVIQRIEEVGNGRMLGPAMLPHVEALKEVLR